MDDLETADTIVENLDKFLKNVMDEKDHPGKVSESKHAATIRFKKPKKTQSKA